MTESSHSLEYLRATAKKYGMFYFVHQFERFVQRASREELEELASVYQEIARREDSARISRWVDSRFKEQDKIRASEFQFRGQVGQMLRLFDYLSEHGVSPFTSGEVRYVEERTPIDWRKLPESLQYLAPAAEKYGKLIGEAAALDFLDTKATTADLQELASVAEKVRLRNDYPAVSLWMDKQDQDDPEPGMLYNLFLLMDHAGLDFEPGTGQQGEVESEE